MTTPYVISFVSGKGGVGKTMLAANVAWQCSKLAKTLLIDLDFHNQGCTGLMAPHFDLSDMDAFTAITASKRLTDDQVTVAEDRLLFLPAVSWANRPSTELVLDVVNAAHFLQQIQCFLCDNLPPNVGLVVLDCHGGLDPVSWSAFQSSEITFMITEADSVTFAGTLELLRYYEEQSHRANTFSSTRHQHFKEFQGNDPTLKGHVEIVVNRLPSKYKFKDLEILYRPYMQGPLGSFSRQGGVFCYIPSEELLADSFGEYPFYIEVSSNSLYSRKVQYITYSILRAAGLEWWRVPGVRRFARKGYETKVLTRVISDEQRNVSSVMSFFAWASITIVSFIVLFAIALSLDAMGMSVEAREVGDKGWRVFAIVLGAPTFFYLSAGLIGITLYYRRRYLYQKKLFHTLRRPITIWQRVALVRSFALRWSTAIGMSIVALFAVGAVIGFTVEILSPLVGL